MGLTNRKKSGNKIDGSKLNVMGQGIKTVKPGGNNVINQQKGDTTDNSTNKPN
jgi:hypothetical protein